MGVPAESGVAPVIDKSVCAWLMPVSMMVLEDGVRGGALPGGVSTGPPVPFGPSCTEKGTPRNEEPACARKRSVSAMRGP